MTYLANNDVNITTKHDDKVDDIPGITKVVLKCIEEGSLSLLTVRH